MEAGTLFRGFWLVRKDRASLRRSPTAGEHSDRRTLKNLGPMSQGELELLRARVFRLERDNQDLQQKLRVAEQSEDQLQLIFDSAAEYAIFTADRAGLVTSWNRGAERLLGFKEAEIVGRDSRILFTPEDCAKGDPEREIENALTEGRAINERWHLRQDGSRFWGSGLMMRLNGEGSRGLLKIMRDDTERHRMDRLRQLLIRELNHRVKNTLSVVQAIASQTLQSANSLELFSRAFSERLQALADAHDILARETWVSADMTEVVHAALKTWLKTDRISLSGPSVRVSPKHALALSLALHELATNAVKHGALSIPTGRVSVSWQCGSDCQLRWVERGGPLVSPPARQGFGLRILNRGLGSELGREVQLDFNAAGLTCVIQVPVAPTTLDDIEVADFK